MDRKRSVRRTGSRKYKKPFSEKCKDFMRHFIAFMFSNVGIIGLVVGYTIAGAFIFQAIEGHIPEDVFEEIVILRNQTAEKLWKLLEKDNLLKKRSWKNSVTLELVNYTLAVTDAIRNGYDGPDESKPKWTFPGAFLYSLTVITTIGYGNVAPKTPWGKITTILYAIIGMPLFLLYLSNIGDILARCFKWLYAKCCLCLWCPNVARRREERRRHRDAGGTLPPWNGSPNTWERRRTSGPVDQYGAGAPALSGSSEEDVDDDDSEAVSNGSYDAEYDTQTVTVPVTICLAIMVGYVCAGAILFSEYEGWNFLNGSYFCFISLSTIGFGDIVPGENTYYQERFALSFVFCSMYLMLGMALIAMCFNLMQEEVIHKIRNVMRTLRRIFR